MNKLEIILLSCYELGHQPLGLAWPLGALAHAGFSATGVDLAVAPLPSANALRKVNFVGIAVPMHTALRLGVQTAIRIREIQPEAHICFYGLYAWLNADYLLEQGISDSVIGGEYEAPLVKLVEHLAKGLPLDNLLGVSTRKKQSHPFLSRIQLPVPLRETLPSLKWYAHLAYHETARQAGYTETSRGCLHTCKHCPIVPVYNGRFFVMPFETIMADIQQQVLAGAQHITFGDPDFLNGPGHARKVTQALHSEFPDVTFDFTTKVEHILKHPDLLADLRKTGAVFVVSAFESVSDNVLARLNKGHTTKDLDKAIRILSDIDLPVQPTWVAFTPWTSLNDYLGMLEWIRARGLEANIPAIQLSIRLLIPPHSALLQHSDIKTWLGPLDPANFSYRWKHSDPRMDYLQKEVVILAEEMADQDNYTVFTAIEQIAYQLADRPIPAWSRPVFHTPVPPRLTEDWFC